MKPKPKPYKAAYKGATPRQVAAAVLRYRPEKKRLPDSRDSVKKPQPKQA